MYAALIFQSLYKTRLPTELASRRRHKIQMSWEHCLLVCLSFCLSVNEQVSPLAAIHS